MSAMCVCVYQVPGGKLIVVGGSRVRGWGLEVGGGVYADIKMGQFGICGL